MWPDIKKVSLFDETPVILEKLTRTTERFKASNFFVTFTPYEWGVIDVDKNYRLQIKSWLNWAALVAFPNPSNDDPLQKDLEDIGLAKKWENSEEKQKLYADPLIAVLLELRNYEVHFELRVGVMRNFEPLYGSLSRPDEAKKMDYGENLYISQIDYQSLSQIKNIKSGKSNVNIEMVNWFNRQISVWPAAEILGVAKERYGFFVAEFLNKNGIT